MDVKTWNSLSNTEQNEVQSMSSSFIKQVCNSNAIDGRDFMNKYEIKYIDGYYYIFEKTTNSKLGDFKSKSENVIKALMTDAGQNYGR